MKPEVPMAAIDTSTLDHLVETFKQLPSDQQLIVLSRIYVDMENTLPALGDPKPSEKMQTLGNHILNMDKDEQIAMLLTIVSGSSNLHTPEIDEFEAEISQSDRIELLYIFASKMGKGFAAPPEPYAISEEADSLVEMLNSHEANDKIRFMTQIVQ